MVEPEPRPSAAQRLGAPETLGISTLDHGHKPPTMPPGRHVTIRVQMLDGTEEVFDISQRASGRVLFDMVCAHLNLIEGDYFGLEFQDHHKMTVWLDLLKPIMKQLRRPKHTTLRFVVKFFPPDHAQLMEELTRYLFALQIKQDLASGRLTCNDTSAALLVSHIIQSEIGDFEETQCRQHLLNNNYIPDQMALLDKIMEFHSKHVGHTPAVSDFQLLEIARRLEMCGVRLHPAKDREGTKLSLAVSHTGVLVFQGHTKINAFNWSKVRKLSFKRKRFLIKLRPDLNESAYQDTLEFLMASRDCCKVFWKICVEYHAFFRLFEEPKPKPKPVLFSRGSSFRFSGRTQKQVIEYVKESEFKKIPFDRKHSKVQHNSSLSPLPSLIRSQVPTESASCTSAERTDSPARRSWKETALVCAEDSGMLRMRCSPSAQRNGREDRFSPPSVDGRSPATAARQPAPELLNAAGGGSNSPRPSESSLGLVNGHRHGDTGGPSPDGRQPSPLTSPLLNDVGCVRTDDEDEARRKRFPTDKAYFIAKELLTTERTYLKDLEVVTVSFQNLLLKEESTPDSLKNVVMSNFEPLYKFHTGFLREAEQRLALWEGRSNAHIKGDYQRIGDVMLKNIQGLKQLTAHLQKLSEVLLELEKACRVSRRLEGVCREFEQQKVCYVPLNVFILRPLHRLVHYKQILERLCKHYPATHDDFRDSRAALADISELVSQLHGSMIKMENFQKLLELKKDLIGIDNLATPGREFIRLGCLSKLSGKGLQQRMFFLFNDVLLYTSRGMTSTNQFKVHGQLPLHGMTIRESEEEWAVPHCFTLVGQRHSVVVAASCVSEMEKWMEDVKMAIDLAETSNGPTADLLANSNDIKSPGEWSAEAESEEDLSGSRSSLERQTPHRGNTTAHVCWHRNTSVSMLDFSLALENQLSGNLLRKFKNSNGWQKLWVVFTNFSLFFYKTHQDDYPLASLPLLGYSVTIPSESENIHKDYVFKLHFKSHVYYFRSESEYSFERWMEVIRSATVSASRTPGGGSNSPRPSESSLGLVNGHRHGDTGGPSPDGRQPSPLTSPLLNDVGCVRTDDEDEARRKRFPTDKAYFIAKELLTTERTYLKDLEVVTVSFQNLLLKEESTPDSLKNVVMSNFEPLYKFHTGFLREAEQRLALWEGRSNAHIKGDYQRIGDVMLKNIQGLKQLTAHLQKLSEVLLELEKACRVSRRLEGVCREFEQQKVCYVPLNVFILRPLHRLVHYKQILERLCKHYPATHDDFRDSRAALADISELVSQLHGSMIKMENFQKLLELKKDLIGIDNLATPGREFIRLGCLSKLSGKGLQQRMFFLFNDVLLYTSRGMTSTNQFKVHGQLPLHGMTIRESEEEWAVPHCFTLVGQRHSVVVAASCVSEMEKWMEDVKMAIDLAETSNGPTADLLANSNDIKSPGEWSAEAESEEDLSGSRSSLERQTPHRGNTTAHVCWHRNTSVSMLDFSLALENQLSGNLLRKFKNSNGWQKLWVVFTNFSLFFYKTHQDDYPLASLPLLGYSVTIPSESENIHKDYVFKLHFKSHVYYFRSESEYSFERWMEVIRSATVSASRTRILNRKESHPY